MTAGLDGGATAAALGVSAGVTYDGALTLLSGKRKGERSHPGPWLAARNSPPQPLMGTCWWLRHIAALQAGEGPCF